MKREAKIPVIYAMIAAVLFGIWTPCVKLFLEKVEPIQMAGLVGLGTALGLMIVIAIESIFLKKEMKEASISKSDLEWIVGAGIIGEIIGPVVCFISLKHTLASTASLLLGTECVITAIIAMLFFKEAVGKRVWVAAILITLASIILTGSVSQEWDGTLGALGIIFACVLWGIDNNMTRNVSGKDPVLIVASRGLVAGVFLLFLSGIIGEPSADAMTIVYALILGFLINGVGLVLYVRALRNLGTSRTGVILGIEPFVGSLLALVLLKESQGPLFFIALVIMALGIYLIFNEKHCHEHEHEGMEHEHMHSHNDGHHNHTHEDNKMNMQKVHTHTHKHEKMIHTHAHLPDIHHRHRH